jgi:AsmA protein
MSRTLKILGILVVTAVAVIVFAAIVFVLVFDPNDYKDKISEGVKEATGRELVIEGDLHLSLFPWLAIEMGKTELGNAPGFDDTPFASFDSARLSVRVMPLLLQRQVVVGTAALDSLRVNLQVRKDGTGNWEDLGEAGEAEPEAAEAQADGPSATIDIASVAVTDAALTYSDASTGDRFEVTDLTLTSGRIAAGEAVPLDGGFAFSLDPAGLSGRVDMGVVVAFDMDAATIAVSDLDVEGRVDGVAEVPATIRFRAPSIGIQTGAQTADVGEIRLQLMSVDLEADVEPFSYAGDPQPAATISIAAFSPRTLMQELAIEAPPTADPDVLDKLTVDAKAKVGANAITLSDLRLVLDDTTFTGRLSVPKSADGTFELDLAGDSIDIARYMAPPTETAAGDESASETVEIPVELIRALNARGNLSIASASLGKILFEKVTLGLNAANGKLRIHPITADFFDGGYRGDVQIDASGKVPSIAVDENIANVSLRPMVKAMYDVDNVTGTVNGNFRLGGSGADMDAIRRDLDGSLSVELQDGAWEGTDVWYELRKARALIKGEPAPKAPATPRTQFSSMVASGKVTDGVLRNDDFFAQLPFMQLSGKGSVNFVEATVDYTATGRFLEKPEFVTDVSEEELDDFTKAVIPFRITGPLADPDIKPDVEEMLKDRAEKEAKKAIADKLFGDDEKEPPQEGEEPQEEKDIEDQLKDEAKKRLRDLLGGD